METRAQIADPVFTAPTDAPSRLARYGGGAKSVVAPLVLLAIFLATWQWLPGLLNVSPSILPKFSDVAAVFTDVSALQLYAQHGWVTLKEAGSGLLIGGTLGFVAGIALTESKLLMRSFYPYIVALQCMPKVAIAPLLVIWFGFGITSKVIVVALLCFFPILVNTITGVRSASREQLELFAAVRASRLQTHRHLLIPAALPSIMTGIELAVVVSLLGAIVGEFVGAEQGLGVLLLQAQFQMAMPSVFAILLVLALMGVVFNLVTRAIRRKALFWIAGESGK